MAAITPTSVYRESLGSLTLMIVNLTTTTTSDTYTIQANSPVLDFWAQSNTGQGFQSPDVTFTASTGVFALTSGTTGFGVITLFVLMRT